MATRATIAVHRADGRYDAVQLHFDGYPEYAGTILRAHHMSLTKAEALIAGGHIRSLDEKSGAPEYFADGTRPERLRSHDDLVGTAKQMWSQYLYVFDGETWSCVAL